METKPSNNNTEACAGLAATTGSDLDQYQSEEYQWFVAETAKFCHCAEQHKPCDGVLAGGICDMRLDTERWSFCDE